MHLAVVALLLSVVNSSALPSTSSVQHSENSCGHGASSPVAKNANHIFNAIHSSMRQWGSSLHHNGMSFFLATIPAGTELYHGRGSNATVKGFEWLAFEPEHAMNFAAKVVQGPDPPKHGKPPPDQFVSPQREPVFDTHDMTHAEHTKLRHQQLLGFNDDATGEEGQHSSPPRRPPRDDFEVVPGWLHTYRMKRDLRVIYIDGEAAAKSQKGTLDTQDYILAPVSDHNGEREPGHSPGGEYRRARDMCNMAEHAWLGRIDGFIRMEHGFELILCDFEESSDLVQMSRVNDWRGVSNDDVGVFLFTFLRAIVARYHRIGGERVRIDYDNFVTAFASDLDLFRSSSSDLPRLDSITNEQRAKLIADLTEVVMNYDSELTPENWQSIADLIVARYSDALHSFAFDTFSSKSVLDFSLTLLLRPFIDYDARNRSLELSRCATHFVPAFRRNSIAGTATLVVSTHICEVLFSTYNDTDVDTSQSKFKDLVDWLKWTTWKDCRPGCKYDEFCFTAIWPMGDIESHERPYCVNSTSLQKFSGPPGSGESYWMGPDGPRNDNSLQVGASEKSKIGGWRKFSKFF